MLLLADAELMKDLARSDEGRIVTEPIRKVSLENNRPLSPLDYHYHEPGWQEVRSLYNIGLKPEFLETISLPQLTDLNSDYLRSLMGRLVPNTENPELGDWKVTDIKKFVTDYTFKSVGKIFLGVKFDENSLKDLPYSVDGFVQDSNDVLDLNLKLKGQFPLYQYYETKDFKKLKESLFRIDKFAKVFLEKFSESSNPEKPRMKELLIERAKDFKDSEKMVNSVITGSFIAATDVTSKSLVTLLFRIAHEQEYQEKLYHEITEVLGEPTVDELESENGYQISFEQFKLLKLCKNFVEESLRMNHISYTPSARLLSKDIVIGNRYHLPEGTTVIPFESPETQSKYMEKSTEFIPERFDKSSPYAPTTSLVSNPFGMGERKCPGMRVANTELLLALVNTVRHFKLAHSDPSEFPPMENHDSMFVINTEKNGLYLNFRGHFKNYKK